MADPIFNIDDFLAAQNAQTAPAASATQPASRAFGVGKALGKAARMGGRVAGPVAAGTVLAEGALGEPSVANAIRTGVGLGAIVNPAVGVPLATGMATGGALTEFIGNRLIDSTLAANDIRGPATKEFLARGGQTTAPVTPESQVTGAVGGDISTAVAAPPEAAAAAPAPSIISSPGVQFGPLPTRNIYGERPGVRGIGGIGGIGNTQITNQPATGTDVGNIAGNFMGAMLGLKQISGDNAQRLAQQKAQTAALAARGTFARGSAAMGESLTAQTLAAEHLRANPGDFAGAGAVLRGRMVGAGMKPSIPMGGVGMNPQKDPSLVFDPKTQTTKLVYPTQDITMAQAVASAKRNNTYKSDAQVRADLAKMQNFRLVD